MKLATWLTTLLVLLATPAMATPYRVVLTGSVNYLQDDNNVLGTSIHIGDPVETILTYDPAIDCCIQSPQEANYLLSQPSGSMSTQVGPFLNKVDWHPFSEFPLILVIVWNNLIIPYPDTIFDRFGAQGTVSPSASTLPTVDGLQLRFDLTESHSISEGIVPSLLQSVALPTSSMDLNLSSAIGLDGAISDTRYGIFYQISSVQISPLSIPESPSFDLFLVGMLFLAAYESMRFLIRTRATKVKLIAPLIAILVVAISFHAHNACATPVTWILAQVTFNDGGRATGTFTFDADTGQYSPVGVVTSGGNFPSPDYNNLFFGYYVAYGDAYGTGFDGLSHDSRTLFLTYSSPLTNSGGTVALAGGSEFSRSWGSRSIVRGFVSTSPDSIPPDVPEPASIMLLAAGLARLVALRREHG